MNAIIKPCILRSFPIALRRRRSCCASRFVTVTRSASAPWPTCPIWEPARVEALRRALRGAFDHLTGGDPICGPVFGVLYALKHVADDLGITGVLGRRRPGKLSLFLTLARVAHQGSRLSAVRWAQQHAVREVLGVGGFDEDDLYRTLDAVG